VGRERYARTPTWRMTLSAAQRPPSLTANHPWLRHVVGWSMSVVPQYRGCSRSRGHCLFSLLRGKLLNVKDISQEKFSKNEEQTAVKAILGLRQGAKYTAKEAPWYGRVMVMADQDHDGRVHVLRGWIPS
jgi:hypothetical protein